MRKLLPFIILLFSIFLYDRDSFAQYVRTNCSDISPGFLVANGSTCAQTTTASGRTAGSIYKWNGSTWADILTGISASNLSTGTIPGARNTSTLLDGSQYGCIDSGSSDDYICNRATPAAAHTTNSLLILVPNTINTGPATVDPDNLGVKTIVQHDGSALTDGLLQVGRPYILTYDGTNYRTQPSGGGSGTITGSCSTTNALGKFTSSTALGCSDLVDAGSGVFNFGVVAGNRYVMSFATPTAVRTILIPDQAALQISPFGVYWDGAMVTPDGTNCVDATKQQLNSGRRLYTFSCGDSNSSIIFGEVDLPVAVTTATFRIKVFHGTTETITFAGKFEVACRAAGTTINDTWSTPVAANVSITTANQEAVSTSSAITPNGTCSVGTTLAWRYVIDAANFSTNATNSKFISVYMEKAS